MADKKKKKAKMKEIVSKQNLNKQQVQQVTVNVGVGRRSSNKQQRQQAQPQAKAPNFNYELFRTINSYITQQQKETPKDTSPALYQNTQQAQPTAKLPQPNTPPPSNIARVIQNNKIHNSTFVPQETKRLIAHDFEKILSTKKAVQEDETEYEDNNLPVRKPFRAAPPEEASSLPEASGVRLNKKGLPDRRSKEGKRMYELMMSKKNEEEGKPSGNNEQPPTATPLQNSASVQPVNFEPKDDEEDDLFFSPLRTKPT